MSCCGKRLLYGKTVSGWWRGGTILAAWWYGHTGTKYLLRCWSAWGWRFIIVIWHLVCHSWNDSFGRVAVMLECMSVTVIMHVSGKSSGVIIVSDFLIMVMMSGAFSWPRSNFLVVLKCLICSISLRHFRLWCCGTVAVCDLGMSGHNDVGLGGRRMRSQVIRWWRHNYLTSVRCLNRLNGHRILTTAVAAMCTHTHIYTLLARSLHGNGDNSNTMVTMGNLR